MTMAVSLMRAVLTEMNCAAAVGLQFHQCLVGEPHLLVTLTQEDGWHCCFLWARVPSGALHAWKFPSSRDRCHGVFMPQSASIGHKLPTLTVCSIATHRCCFKNHQHFPPDATGTRRQAFSTITLIFSLS